MPAKKYFTEEERKEAKRVWNQRWRNKNPERSRLQVRKSKQKHPTSSIVHQAQGNAKSRGLEFNITKDDIHIPEYCPVFGIKLGKVRQGGGKHADCPSIDRIDSSKGYVKGNIRIISWRANYLKKDASAQEISAIISYMRKYLEK